MKKKYLKIGLVIMCTAVGALCMNFSYDTNVGTSLLLNNVEALAQTEQPSPDKYVRLDLPCFDVHGNKTGKSRRSCSHPGFEPTCIPHGCQ